MYRVGQPSFLLEKITEDATEEFTHRIIFFVNDFELVDCGNIEEIAEGTLEACFELLKLKEEEHMEPIAARMPYGPFYGKSVEDRFEMATQIDQCARY